MLTSILLSPAKALDLVPLSIDQQNRLSKFQIKSGFKFQETQILADYLCQKTSTELSELLEISANLADLNYTRYQKYWLNTASAALHITPEMKPAAFMFNGDAYQHLDIHHLGNSELNYLNQYLLIFSGLYGFLRAFDYIKPYRIDMGTGIVIEKNGRLFKNLYQIWQPILANAWFDAHVAPILMNFNHQQPKPSSVGSNDIYLINLASTEYAKAFSLRYLNSKNQELLSHHNLNIKIVDIDFKQRKKDGTFASIGIKNKQARGLFLRYMAEHQIINIKKCFDFREDGYIFNAEQSQILNSNTEKVNLVFIQG